jgi:beta-glucanase (GH16 family)
MTRRPARLAVFLLLACVAQAPGPRAARAAHETPSGRADMRLVWADEFDVAGRPDPRHWTPEVGFVRNEEHQYYRPENARCERGLLILEARRERVPNGGYDPKGRDWRARRLRAEYTSASLTTRGLHAWRYGRFEMRGRIDTRPGLWPAFWTVGTEGEWPRTGEIDIMEYYRGMLLANVAWGGSGRWQARWDDSRRPIASFADPGWADRFHVWRMDWDEREIRLYVDDVLLNSTDLGSTFNEGERRNPLRQPHFLILNLAVGGTNGGDPSRTRFPARFEVDWVRVYQGEGAGRAGL